MLVNRRTSSDWLSEIKSVGDIWRSLSKSDAEGYLVGPTKLVIDDTALARIMIIRESTEINVRKVLKEVPFGDQLQKAVTEWRKNVGPY